MSLQDQAHQSLSGWRCGICLFTLPENTATIEDDIPPPGEFPPALSTNTGKPYMFYRSGLQRSVKRKCEICKSLASIIRFPGRSVSDEEMALQWVHGKLSIWPAADKSYRIFAEAMSTSAFPEPQKLHPCLTAGRCPSGDTQSSQVFEFLKTRMQYCFDRHKQCSDSNRWSVPERLIYIEDASAPILRLVENTSQISKQPYVCLSHRWKDQTLASSLNKSRITTFMKQIPPTLLYPLLRDAIEVTKRLGFRYIWIDCLCICQDDSDDWSHQASQMSAIYENAVLTISALDAQLTGWRLFSRQPSEKIQKLGNPCGQAIMIEEVANETHPFTINAVAGQYMVFNPYPTLYPLLGRGWVYQERILSRRIVYFTAKEVIWECREAMSCECGYDESLWGVVKQQAPTLSDMRWHSICCEYKKTELSIASDKLPALSGVARRFGEARRWTYLAGSWREDPDLRMMLLWFVASARSRQRIQGMPSWSWASVPSAYFSAVSEEEYLKYRVTDHEVVGGVVPYSTPSSATVTVEGLCAPVIIKFNQSCSSFGVVNFPTEKIFSPLRFDYVFDERTRCQVEQSTDILFLLGFEDHEQRSGLILMPVNPQKNSYERIGSLSYWDKTHEPRWETRSLILV